MEMEQHTPETSLEQQIAEAEERGYRRGLNEQIESKMKEPAVWEGQDAAETPPPPPGFQILGNRRKSFWDN